MEILKGKQLREFLNSLPQEENISERTMYVEVWLSRNIFYSITGQLYIQKTNRLNKKKSTGNKRVTAYNTLLTMSDKGTLKFRINEIYAIVLFNTTNINVLDKEE